MPFLSRSRHCADGIADFLAERGRVMTSFGSSRKNAFPHIRGLQASGGLHETEHLGVVDSAGEGVGAALFRL
jgi:hypothetical protein